MKVKPVTIYVGFIIAVLLFIFFFVGEENKVADPYSDLPEDDVHGNLPQTSGEAPSKENVSEKVKQRIAELRNNITENPADTVSMKELAQFQYMAHEMEEAIELYKTILSYDDKRTDIQFAVGVIHYNNKEFDAAEAIMNKIIGYDSDNTVAVYNLGAINLGRGNTGRAKEYWNSIINNYPDSHEAFLAETALKKLENEGK